MTHVWWSAALTTIGLVGLFRVYRAPASILGPAISVAAQALWISYAVVTQQWPFIVSAIAYGVVNAYGIAQRRSERPRYCHVHGTTGCSGWTPDCPRENRQTPRRRRQRQVAGANSLQIRAVGDIHIRNQ